MDAKAAAAPFTSAVAYANDEVRDAERALRSRERELADAKPWRRSQLREAVAGGRDALDQARARLDHARDAAAPFRADLDAASERVLQAEIDARRVRLQVSLAPTPHRTREIDHGIDLGR